MTALSSLLARIEAGSGPDRDMDREIHTALGLGMDEHIHTGVLVNAYTASLDAAVALVEWVLPGWWWDVCTYEPGRYEAFVNPPDYQGPDEQPCGMGIDATAPRALVRALLRAEIAWVEDAAIHSRQTPGAAHE